MQGLVWGSTALLSPPPAAGRWCSWRHTVASHAGCLGYAAAHTALTLCGWWWNTQTKLSWAELNPETFFLKHVAEYCAIGRCLKLLWVQLRYGAILSELMNAISHLDELTVVAVLLTQLCSFMCLGDLWVRSFRSFACCCTVQFSNTLKRFMCTL